MNKHDRGQTINHTDMNMYQKAAAQLRKKGMKAWVGTMNGGGLFVDSLNSSGDFFELSFHEVKKWAELYDDSAVDDIRNEDPRYLLGEIAKIFHTHGWVLDDEGIEPEVTKANDKFLQLIYEAFKPQRN